MGIEELCELDSIVDSPVKLVQDTEELPRTGTKRKVNRDFEGWNDVKVLEVKRRKKNEQSESSPDSSPIYFRKLETKVSVHCLPTKNFVKRLSAEFEGVQEEEEEDLLVPAASKSDTSTDCDIPLLSTPQDLKFLKVQASFSKWDEIILVESYPLTPQSPSSLPMPEDTSENILPEQIAEELKLSQ